MALILLDLTIEDFVHHSHPRRLEPPCFNKDSLPLFSLPNLDASKPQGTEEIEELKVLIVEFLICNV